MKGFKVLIALGMSVAASLTIAATPVAKAPTPGFDFKDVKPFMDAVHSGQINPETYDFEAAGFFKLEPLERDHWKGLMFEVLGQTYPPVISECSQVHRQNDALIPWMLIVTQSKDAADWKANAEPLRARLVELDKDLKRSAPAKPSADPLVQELLVRFARDQDVREKIVLQKKWIEGLPKVAADYWMMAASTRMAAIDCDNTAWLKQQLPKIGWFTIPKYGEEADTAAWHLVQHADREPTFQREMLTRLQALPKGDTSGKRLGYLWDRVARQEGKLQRYGTQGQCKDGQWSPYESEDPANLDKRRISLGMEPIAEHMKVASREVCPH